LISTFIGVVKAKSNTLPGWSVQIFAAIDFPRFFASDPDGSTAISGIQKFALTMPERHLNRRDMFKQDGSVALAGWRQLAAEQHPSAKLFAGPRSFGFPAAGRKDRGAATTLSERPTETVRQVTGTATEWPMVVH